MKWMSTRLVACLTLLLTPVSAYGGGPDAGASSQGSEDADTSSESDASDSTEMTPFYSLLGEEFSPDELEGCRSGWEAAKDDHGDPIIICSDFHGPSRFNGSTTFVRSKGDGDAVNMVFSAWKSPKGPEHQGDAIKSMVETFTDLCGLPKTDSSPALWKCHRHGRTYYVQLGPYKTGLQLIYYSVGAFKEHETEVDRKENKGL